jgi:hypothetical protein
MFCFWVKKIKQAFLSCFGGQTKTEYQKPVIMPVIIGFF